MYCSTTSNAQICEIALKAGPDCTTPAVTFSAEATAYVGDEVALTFSSTNENAVSYTIKKDGEVTTDASIADGKFTATAAGEYTITASQAADETNGICAVEETVTITVNAKAAVESAVIKMGETSGSASVEEGTEVTLTCEAANATAWQWYVGGEEITGANSATYVFTPAAQGEFVYTVKASNDFGNATSEAFTLTVTAATFHGTVTGVKENVTTLPASALVLPDFASDVWTTANNTTKGYVQKGNVYVFSAYAAYYTAEQTWAVGTNSATATWSAPSESVFCGSKEWNTTDDKVRYSTLKSVSERINVFRVKNCIQVQALTAGNSDRDNYIDVYKIEYDVSEQPSLGDIVGQDHSTGNPAILSVASLDASQEYAVVVYCVNAGSSNSSFYELALTYPTIAVTGVTLDKSEITLAGLSDSEQLTATIAPANATNKQLTWTSADETIATVSSEGLVTPVAGGTTTITVTTADGSFTATCSVTVDASAKSSDATLTAVSLGNTAVEMTAFAEDAETGVYTYSYELAYGEALPAVTVTPAAGATVDKTEPTEAPCEFRYVVTAEDETTTKTYIIEFTVADAPKDLYEVVFSNGLKGAIDATQYTITIPYMAGEDAPTFVSAAFTKWDAGGVGSVDAESTATAAMQGELLRVTGADGKYQDYTIIAQEITPMTFTADEITLTEVPAYAFALYPWDDTRKMRIAQGQELQTNKRISTGINRLYLFLPPASSLTLTSSVADRTVEVKVNGVVTDEMIKTGNNGVATTLTLDPTKNNIVSIEQTAKGGDAGFGKLQLTAPPVADVSFLFNPDIWNTGDAQFAVWYWIGEIGAWAGNAILSEQDCLGRYIVTVPGNIDGFNIVRLNNTATTPNWDDRWNQTVDATLADDLTKVYTITAWGNANNEYVDNDTSNPKSTGEWQTATVSSLYLLGNVKDHNWTPAQTPQFTYDAESCTYTIEATLTEYEGYGFFSFITTLSGDWSVVNANRYGAAADGTEASLTESNALTAGEYTYKLPAAEYRFVVKADLSSFTATVLSGLTTYAVSFLDAEGETIVTGNYPESAVVTPPDAPASTTMKRFAGWALQGDEEQTIVTDFTVTAAATYVPVFTDAVYVVTGSNAALAGWTPASAPRFQLTEGTITAVVENIVLTDAMEYKVVDITSGEANSYIWYGDPEAADPGNFSEPLPQDGIGVYTATFTFNETTHLAAVTLVKTADYPGAVVNLLYPSEWFGSEWSGNPRIWAWQNESDNLFETWPGEEMTYSYLEEGQGDYFTYVFPADVTSVNVLFNNGNTEAMKQTANVLAVTGKKEYKLTGDVDGKGHYTVVEKDYYKVSVAEMQNGTVTVAEAWVKAGETATLTIAAAEDYLPSVLRYNGTAIELVDGQTEYTFTMPAEAVTVTAAFRFSQIAPAAENTYYLFGNDNQLTGEFQTGKEATAKLAVLGDEDPNYVNGIVPAGNTSLTGSNMKNADRWIRYDVKTTKTAFEITTYANNSSDIAYTIAYIKEAGDGAGTMANYSAENTTDYKAISKTVGTATYQIETAVNTSIYFYAPSNATKLEFLQIKAVESGEALPMAGEAGYEFNFNKGRLSSNKTVQTYEGLEILESAGYYSNSNAYVTIGTKGTNYLKFTTAAKVNLNVIPNNNAMFYVAADKDATGLEDADQQGGEKGTTYTIPVEAGTHYIVPAASLQLTKIFFSAYVLSDDATLKSLTIGDKAVDLADFAVDEQDATKLTIDYQLSYGTETLPEIAYEKNNEKASAADNGNTATDGATVITVTAEAGNTMTYTIRFSVNQTASTDATLKTITVAGAEVMLTEGTAQTYELRIYQPMPAAEDIVVATTDNNATVGTIEITDNVAAFTVTPESGAEAAVSYTLTFTRAAATQLQPVSEATTWDWADVVGSQLTLTATTLPALNTDFNFADIEGITYKEGFNAAALMGNGQRPTNGNNTSAQLLSLKFNTTVSGMVTITYSNTGNSNSNRWVTVNGVQVGEEAVGTTKRTTPATAVAAGEVVIATTENLLRFYKIEFTPATVYTVRFMDGETEIASTSYVEDATITVPADLEKENATFLGWYLSTDETQTIVDLTNATATADITYMAKWEQTAPAVDLYKLQKVTSVEAGKMYVFEQDGHVMTTVSSSAVQTTDAYLTKCIDISETIPAYIWTLETAETGFYMKNLSLEDNPYLANTSSTGVSAAASGSDWSFTFQTDETVIIQNNSNGNRFLGFTNATSYAYKAYATSNLSSTSYPHAINVYQLVAQTGTTYSVTVAESYTNGAVTATPSDCLFENDEVTLIATPSAGYKLNLASVKVGETSVTLAAVQGKENTYTFPMPAVSGTLALEFEELPKFDVTVATLTNGAIVADPATAVVEGATVTLTVTPAEHYQLKANTLTITDASENTVAYEATEGKYTFTMPASAVTVSAEFEAIAVQSVSLSGIGATLSLTTDEATYQFVAVVAPADALNPAVEWTSSNPTVATIDQTGLMTITGEGQTVITVASQENSELKAECTVTVSSTAIAVESIALDKDYIYLDVDGTTTIAVNYTPSDATDQTVTWSGLDEVVSIDAEGNITALKAGEITATATTANGKTAQVTIVVGEAAADGYVLTDIDDIAEGQEFVIAITREGDYAGTYAMRNDAASNAAPAATAVTVVNNTIAAPVAANLLWNVVKDATNGYMFTPNGDATKWLVMTNTNNGVRINTGDTKYFTFEEDANGNPYLKAATMARYLGVYNAQDFRCYNATSATNIKNQALGFYAKAPDPNAGSITVSPAKVDFGTLTYTGEALTGSEELTISSENLRGEIAVALAGDDVFSVGTLSEGKLTVSYNAAAAGTYTAMLTLTAQDKKTETIEKTVSISLSVLAPVTLAEFLESKPETATLIKDVQVTYVESATNVYVTDGTASIVIYDKDKKMSALTLVNGTILSGLQGTYTGYQRGDYVQPELVLTTIPVAGEGEAVLPKPMTEKPTEANFNEYLKFTEVQVTENGNYYIYDDVQLYQQGLDMTAGNIYTVEGILKPYVSGGNDIIELVLTADPVEKQYTITVPEADANGNKVEATATTATAGTQITLDVTVATGYKLTSLAWNGTALEIVKGQTQYTFQMPQADVQITAAFVEKTEPELTAVPAVIDFGTVKLKDAEGEQTISIIGENLNAEYGIDATITSVSSEHVAFALTGSTEGKVSLPATGGNLTVEFVADEAGEYTATLHLEAADEDAENEITLYVPVTLTVTAPVKVSGLTLSATEKQMLMTTTAILGVTVDNADEADDATYTVTSNADEIVGAELQNDGSVLLTAKQKGTATITVASTDGNAAATCEVSVDNKFTITFKDSGGESDTSTKRTTIDDIISSGADWVESLSDITNVYQARAGYGLKLGASSKIGSLTLNLAQTVKPAAVVVNAAAYNTAGQGIISVNGTEYDMKDFGVRGIVPVRVAYDGQTDLSAVNIATPEGGYRAYVMSFTVYMEETAYSISKGEMVNGDITIEPLTAKVGEEVALTLNPIDAGYELKSISVKQGENTVTVATDYSRFLMPEGDVVVTAEFAELPPMTIAEFIADENTPTVARRLNPLTVAYANGQNTYVKDETGWILIYDATKEIMGGELEGLPNGTVLTGLKGRYNDYLGQAEIFPTEAPSISQGEAVAPVEMTALPTVEDYNKYVIYTDVELTDGDSLKIGERKVKIYDKYQLGIPALKNALYTVKAEVIRQSGTEAVALAMTEAPAEKTYAISIDEQITNVKSFEVSKTTAIEGEVITVTFEADDCFGLAAGTLTANGTAIGHTDGVYTFTVGREDVVVSAAFEKLAYTVTFDFQNGEENEVRKDVECGTALTAPATPVKAATAQYTYTFREWSPALPATVSETQTYTALYDATVNSYSVTFYVDGEAYGDVQTVAYGAGATAPADPEKAGYTFTGWDADFDNIIGTTVVNATFSINQYTITYKVAGEEDVVKTYDYNAEVEKYTPAEKTGYTFSGWDATEPATMPATNLTFSGTYNINQYNITWIVKGEATTVQVDWNVVPSAPAVEDYMTESTVYTFNGWGEEIVAVSGDKTYTAQFTESVRQYDITWIVKGEATTVQVDWNVVPSAPAVEDYMTESTVYTFNGWGEEI
ncbi:MAG: Ig-like domain-containing protein, partial [Paludibacteraceae bacterium]|nr:Ig-like domain-containing protein [Paludibacteraceae bacterium]